MPKISAIIPVYNAEKYLKRCIDSVLKQTLRNFEIVAVDDGSTDESGKILDELAAMNTELKVFHIENGGVSNARNFGLEKAEGEFIYFLDGDDWIEDNTFQLLYDAIGNDFDIVQAAHDEVDENGNTKIANTFCDKDVFDSKEMVECYFLEIITQSVCNKLFKKCFLNSIKFDKTVAVGEDSKLIYEACKNAKAIRLVSDVTYHYFTRSDSALHGKIAERHFDPIAIFDAQAEECKNDKKLYEVCTRRNMMYDFYLIRIILRDNVFTERLAELRNRILEKKFTMLFSKYCALKYKLGILMLWFSPRLFYKIF